MKKTMLTIALGVVVGLLSIIGMQAAPTETSIDWAGITSGIVNSFGGSYDLSIWKPAINAAVTSCLDKKTTLGASQDVASDNTTLKLNVKRGARWLALACATAEDPRELQGLKYVIVLCKYILDARGDASLTSAFDEGYNAAAESKINFVDLSTVISTAAPAAPAAPASGTD